MFYMPANISAHHLVHQQTVAKSLSSSLSLSHPSIENGRRTSASARESPAEWKEDVDVRPTPPPMGALTWSVFQLDDAVVESFRSGEFNIIFLWP